MKWNEILINDGAPLGTFEEIHEDIERLFTEAVSLAWNSRLDEFKKFNFTKLLQKIIDEFRGQ